MFFPRSVPPHFHGLKKKHNSVLIFTLHNPSPKPLLSKEGATWRIDWNERQKIVNFPRKTSPEDVLSGTGGVDYGCSRLFFILLELACFDIIREPRCGWYLIFFFVVYFTNLLRIGLRNDITLKEAIGRSTLGVWDCDCFFSHFELLEQACDWKVV